MASKTLLLAACVALLLSPCSAAELKSSALAPRPTCPSGTTCNQDQGQWGQPLRAIVAVEKNVADNLSCSAFCDGAGITFYEYIASGFKKGLCNCFNACNSSKYGIHFGLKADIVGGSSGACWV